MTAFRWAQPRSAMIESVSGHLQKLVDERDRDRSLAHRRCDALDVAGTSVAHCEHAGTTRFEKIWRPRERPAGVGEFILRDIRARLDKPFVVDRDAPIQPIRVRYRTGHDENVLNAAGLGQTGLVVTQSHTLEMLISLERHDFRVRLQLNRWTLFDPSNQVPRHGLGETILSYEDVHTPSRGCEIHGRLACGVAASDNEHLLAGAELGFHLRGSIVNAGAFELLQVLDARLSIFRTACNDHRPRYQSG